MKTKVTLMLASLLILGACSTGTYVTRSYDDDIYFTPGDKELPAISNNSRSRAQNQIQSDNAATVEDQQIIISQPETYKDGSKGLNNYIFQNKSQSDYVQANMDALDEYDLVNSDTTMIGDEEDYQYIINNYYEMDDLGYSYRINRFHRPFFYGSLGWNYGYWNDWYWDDWYSPYSSWGYGGWGYSPFYSGYYWNSPYYSWYSPYYYGNWGWPYYSGYYAPYYSYNHWGENHGGGFYNNNDYHYGRRTGSYSTINDGRSGSYSSTISRSRDTGLKSGSTGRTEGVSSRRDRPADGNMQEQKNATLIEKRRTADANSYQRNSTTNRTSISTDPEMLQNPPVNRNNSTVTRGNTPSTTSRTYQPGTTTQQRTYVPSYNKPRTVTRSTYNSYNQTNVNRNNNSDPDVVFRNNQNNVKKQSPSDNVRSTYQSKSSYNRGSSSSSTRSSNSSYDKPGSSTPSRSSNNSNYNPGSSRNYSPSSSGSSGSYSSPSGGGGGNSGGGGGGSNSGSSSGGRR